jgi:hypothetical protein
MMRLGLGRDLAKLPVLAAVCCGVIAAQLVTFDLTRLPN